MWAWKSRNFLFFSLDYICTKNNIHVPTSRREHLLLYLRSTTKCVNKILTWVSALVFNFIANICEKAQRWCEGVHHQSSHVTSKSSFLMKIDDGKVGSFVSRLSKTLFAFVICKVDVVESVGFVSKSMRDFCCDFCKFSFTFTFC